MMIIRKNIKFPLNLPIQMFLAIVRYTCKQFEPLGPLPDKLLTLITNPVSDFYCHKRIMSKINFWLFRRFSPRSKKLDL